MYTWINVVSHSLSRDALQTIFPWTLGLHQVGEQQYLAPVCKSCDVRVCVCVCVYVCVHVVLVCCKICGTYCTYSTISRYISLTKYRMLWCITCISGYPPLKYISEEMLFNLDVPLTSSTNCRLPSVIIQAISNIWHLLTSKPNKKLVMIPQTKATTTFLFALLYMCVKLALLLRVQCL